MSKAEAQEKYVVGVAKLAPTWYQWEGLRVRGRAVKHHVVCFLPRRRASNLYDAALLLAVAPGQVR